MVTPSTQEGASEVAAHITEMAGHVERLVGQDDLNWATLLTELVIIAQDVDVLTAYLVELARRDGATWNSIGVMLGVSKQAAQQRFGATTTTD